MPAFRSFQDPFREVVAPFITDLQPFPFPSRSRVRARADLGPPLATATQSPFTPSPDRTVRPRVDPPSLLLDDEASVLSVDMDGINQFASQAGWDPSTIVYAKKPRYSRKHYGFRAVKRTPQSFDRYGQRWGTATPAQKAARMQDGYIGYGRYRRGRRRRGRGMYTGRGWFLGIPTTRHQARRFKNRFGKHGGNFIDAAVKGDPNLAAEGLKGTLALGSGMYTGSGAYGKTVSNDLIMGNNMKVTPKMSTVQDETGALVINNSEYIGEVYGPPGQTFNIQTFALNPGIEATFPWLSQIAQNYEEYEMIQLVFEFRSTLTQEVSDSNGQVGTIMGGVQYNVSNPSFKSKAEMVQYVHTASCRSTSDLNIGVECDPSKTAGNDQKFIRSSQIDPHKELQDYDIGRFEFAMHNLPTSLTNQSIGEMHVYYTVKLSKPKIKTGRAQTVSTQLLTTSVNSQAKHATNAGGQCDMNWLGDGPQPPLSLVRDGLDIKVQNGVAIRANPVVQDGSPLAMTLENLYYDASSLQGCMGIHHVTDTAVSTTQPAQMKNVAKGCTTLTFPASFNGRIEVQGSLDAALQNAIQGIALPNFFWRGEVRPVADIWGANMYQGSNDTTLATQLAEYATQLQDQGSVPGANRTHLPKFGYCRAIITGRPFDGNELDVEDEPDDAGVYPRKFIGAGGMFVAHFDLKQASRGTQNEITIQWPQYDIKTSTVTNIGSLKVFEYNSSLNVKDEIVTEYEKALDPASDKLMRKNDYLEGGPTGITTDLNTITKVSQPLPRTLSTAGVSLDTLQARTNLVDTVEIINCHPTFKDPNDTVVDPTV